MEEDRDPGHILDKKKTSLESELAALYSLILPLFLVIVIFILFSFHFNFWSFN